MLNRGDIIVNDYIQKFQFHIDLHISLEIKTDYPAMLEGHWRALKDIMDFEDKHSGIWKEQSCFILSFCKGSVIQNMILWSDTTSASGLLPYSEHRVLVMV